MFYKVHSKSPWLKKVLVPFWIFQLSIMLALVSVIIWLRASSGGQDTNSVLLVVSAVCIVLCVTEIILFAATRLHPLTYLLIQLIKTMLWFVLFVLAAVDTTRVQLEMAAAEEQGDDSGSQSDYFYVLWFAEPLVLFITFLSSLIYASVVYHRHRRAKSSFLRSIRSKDLFPVATAEEEGAASPVKSPHTVYPAPGTRSVKQQAPAEADAGHPHPAEKEAVEMTLLRELGGDWEVYELPATRSKRSSRGAKSVRSVKAMR